MQAPDDTTFEVKLKDVDASFLYNVVASMPAEHRQPRRRSRPTAASRPTRPNEWMAQNMAGSGPVRPRRAGTAASGSTSRSTRTTGASRPRRTCAGSTSRTRTSRRSACAPATTTSSRACPSIIPDVEGSRRRHRQHRHARLQLLQIGFNMNIPEDALPDGDTDPGRLLPRQAGPPGVQLRLRLRRGSARPARAARRRRGSYFIPEGMYGYDPDAPNYDVRPRRGRAAVHARRAGGTRASRSRCVAEEDSVFEDAVADPQGRHRGAQPEVPGQRAGAAGVAVRRDHGHRADPGRACGRGPRRSSATRTRTTWTPRTPTGGGARWPGCGRATRTRTRSRR